MNNYYKTGDIVHFTATPQAGKNDCSWVASKVCVLFSAHCSNSCSIHYSGGSVDKQRNLPGWGRSRKTFSYHRSGKNQCGWAYYELENVCSWVW
jgi:hypothetical protein